MTFAFIKDDALGVCYRSREERDAYRAAHRGELAAALLKMLDEQVQREANGIPTEAHVIACAGIRAKWLDEKATEADLKEAIGA